MLLDDPTQREQMLDEGSRLGERHPGEVHALVGDLLP
jgi:hypothetical protein